MHSGARIVTRVGWARSIRSVFCTSQSSPPATCSVAEAVTTARMISITTIGGSLGCSRKPRVSTATPRPPIMPSATPPRRMPRRIAPRTRANWIQNINTAA